MVFRRKLEIGQAAFHARTYRGGSEKKNVHGMPAHVEYSQHLFLYTAELDDMGNASPSQRGRCTLSASVHSR
jgi:hypothetical protein